MLVSPLLLYLWCSQGVELVAHTVLLPLLLCLWCCQGPVPATQGAPAATGAMEGKIAKLVELGFTREQAHEALMLTNGNEEQAAGLLFGGL